MHIQNLYAGGWLSNCYLISSDCDAVIIDPSASTEDVLALLQSKGLSLRAILLTHGHFDHLLSLDKLRDATDAPAYVHAADADFPGDSSKSCYRTMLGQDIRHRPVEQTLEDGERLTFGEISLTVMHTPGHTGGSVCYRMGSRIFSGDTIFADGYGRTDLPGGNPVTMRQTLASLSALSQAE
ncbi:MAG: MBL fold metallo-hydrolase, partial [Clostridia bacterium]|nr:MBL fold metallo-hydrolase [Clostridia bacterium]